MTKHKNLIYNSYFVIKVSSVVVFDINVLFIFQLLGECQCWWTRESTRVHVTKFYGRLRLFRNYNVLRASKYPVLELIEIVILWVYYAIPFGFSLFRPFDDITFQLFKLLCFAKDH